ncbi:hypothetical protein SporoP8_10885 [Sporosarcina ureae]|nr:hypothetical protein SporoP8_10885 [Sporosarcina ureae]
MTSVSKANAFNYSMVCWDQVFEEIIQEYPHVENASYLVDSVALLIIKEPARFEAVVTSNPFVDILTDLGAALAGEMGLVT